MLHEVSSLGFEIFATFAHPETYRSIPSHHSTWGICVEEGEEGLVVLLGFLSFFLLGLGRWRTCQPLEMLLLNGSSTALLVLRACQRARIDKLVPRHKSKSPGKFRSG